MLNGSSTSFMVREGRTNKKLEEYYALTTPLCTTSQVNLDHLSRLSVDPLPRSTILNSTMLNTIGRPEHDNVPHSLPDFKSLTTPLRNFQSV